MKKIAFVFFLCFIGMAASAQDNVKKDNDKNTAPTALSFTQDDQDNAAADENVLFFNVSNTRQNKNVSSQALLIDFRCPLTQASSTKKSASGICTKQEDEE